MLRPGAAARAADEADERSDPAAWATLMLAEAHLQLRPGSFVGAVPPYDDTSGAAYWLLYLIAAPETLSQPETCDYGLYWEAGTVVLRGHWLEPWEGSLLDSGTEFVLDTSRMAVLDVAAAAVLGVELGQRDFEAGGAVAYETSQHTQAASQATRASQRLAARASQRAPALQAEDVTIHVLSAREQARILRAMPTLIFD